MQKIIAAKPGQIEQVTVDPPKIGSGDLSIRMEYCGVCGTDVMKVFDSSVTSSIKLGHEIVGIVEHPAGPFKRGDRVAVAHHAQDPTSHFSMRGSETMDADFKSTNVDPCGFAELIRVPQALVPHTVHQVPDTMPAKRAAFMEPLACCIRATDRAQVRAGDTVAVIGFGAMGILFTPLVKSLGAKTVAVDTRGERLALATSWRAIPSRPESAAKLCKDQTDGRGVDSVILTIVTPATLALAMEAVRDGGTIITFGVKPETSIPIDLWQVYRRELTIRSSYSATPDSLKRAIKLLEDDAFAFEKTISHVLPLKEAKKAFDLLNTQQASKILLTP